MGQITTAQGTQHNQYTLFIEAGFYCIYLPLSQQFRAVKASLFSQQQGASIGLNNCSRILDSLNIIRMPLIDRISNNLDGISQSRISQASLVGHGIYHLRP